MSQQNNRSRVIDPANRLTDDSTYNYSYDNNGNLTQKTDKLTGKVTTYSYDAEDRLVNVIPATSVIPAEAGIQSITYAYDPLDRRIQKNVNGAITKYVYDNEDITVEYDGNNNLTASYTHGPQ